MTSAMFGFGVRMNQVFSSRWKALLWAAGVMLTAYCSVPTAPSHDNPAAAADGSGLSQQQQDDVDAALRALNEAGK